MWFLIGVAWLALIAGIVWSYRKQTARRAAERAKQFEQLYTDLKANRGKPVAVEVTTELSPAPAAAAPPPSPSPEFSKKPRLLAPSDALLYYVLRTGLPDHEVFANVALGDIIEVAQAANTDDRVHRLRRFAQQRVDFVVCSRQLEVVAVVLVDREGVQGYARAASLVDEPLRAAGIRLLRIDAAAPPRHHQVRALIYGADE